MKLSINDGAVGYNNKAILENISLYVQQGEIVGILGPNGIGKTTIFRSMIRLLKLIRGDLLLDGIPASRYKAREFAKIVGYVPQEHKTFFPYTVVDVIVMGRSAHLATFKNPTIIDYKIVAQVMKHLGIDYLRNRNYAEISGGERQMVLVARALVQTPRILMMDKPTANLDFGNQVRVLTCIRDLACSGLGVLMTTHNPDHAFLCCDRVMLLTKNKTVLEGPINKIITEENLYHAYGVVVKIVESICPDGKILRTCIPILD